MVKFKSTALLVDIDYQTAQLNFKLHPKDLMASTNELQARLWTTEEPIFISGDLNLRYIPVEKHANRDIKFVGQVLSENREVIEGKGRMKYVYNGLYSSMVRLSIETTFEKLGLNGIIPADHNDITVFIKFPIPNMS